MRSLFALLLFTGCAMASEPPDPNTHDPGPPDSGALEHLVKQDCGSCHGLTLKGGLGPDIRPHAIAHYDANTLAQVVLDGIPGTAMPPWRPIMSEADANWIANYLLTGKTQ